MYAYMFFREAREALIPNLAEYPQVGFATWTSGEYATFAALEVASPEEPVGLLIQLSDGAPVIAETAIALDPSWYLIHPMVQPRKVECYVQIKLHRLGHLRRVRQELFQLDLAMGATIVAGDFDILLQLGADTFSEVEQALLHDLPSIPDVVSRSVALATFDQADEGSRWFWRPSAGGVRPSYKKRLYEESSKAHGGRPETDA